MARRHKILVVDDDPLVVQATVAFLASALPTCDVSGLTSSSDAMARVRTPDLSVLVCDLAMPQPDGVALLKEAQRCNGGIRSLLVTGYATREALLSVINDGSAWRCLEKPFAPDTLLRAVREAIQAVEATRDTPANGTPQAGRPPLVVRKPARLAPGQVRRLTSFNRSIVLKRSKPPPSSVAIRRWDNRATRRLSPLLEHKRYQDLEMISEGSTASVFKARDVLLNTRVAIKLISQKVTRDPRIMATVLAEARLAMQLSHRHIVRLHNIEEVDGSYFLVMEYIGGPTLRTLLKEHGPLPLDTVRQVLDVCDDALSYAHRRTILHCDIKPENLIITDDGVLKVIDFGIACLAVESARQRDALCGTPYYLSPEEIRGTP
ncbi:MAG: protein kinase, partial [Verrucomicrobia bacterium]|nr:protein kinase [Verrucomicrobiota bacterium]